MPNDTDPGPYQSVHVVLRQQNEEDKRVEDIGGGIFRLCGFIEFDGVGELLVPVTFPLTFTQKPSFSFGGELRENSPIQNGNLPTVSGNAVTWRYKTNPQTGQRLYSGTSFAIVTTGHPDQLFCFHYQLEGPAIRDTNPSEPVEPTVHLLGDLWVNGVIDDPPPSLVSSGAIGPQYIGEADLDTATVLYAIDGGAAKLVDASSAPDTGTKVFFGNLGFTHVGAPVHTGDLILYAATGDLANGGHTLSVTVTDVEGHTENKTWSFTVYGAGGGGPT